MRQIETRIVFLFLFVGVVSGRSEVMKGQVVPSTKKFLRSSLIPEYFKGVLLLNETQWGHLDVGAECGRDVKKWLRQLRFNYDDLKRAPNWALKMVDSWGKPPEGLLSGHITSMGDFDECLSVRGGSGHFRGKYCTNYLLPNPSNNGAKSEPIEKKLITEDYRSIGELLSLLQVMSKSEHPVSPTVATCLPSSCSDKDVQLLVSLVFASSELTNSMRPQTGVCYTDERTPLGAGAVVMIIILSILGTLCLAGSIIDLLLRYEHIQGGEFNSAKEKCIQLLMAFSVPKNTQKLLSTQTPPNSFQCLHGIRFLSAIWVVLGHTFFMFMLQPTWNLVDIAQAPSKSFLTLLVVNGGVVVDTFLTMTGVLVSYNILKQLDLRQGRLNVPLMYLSRYLRLTPMYALLIGISATIFPLFSSGPKWNVVQMWSAFCQKNWWHNLLYINNLNIYDPNYSSSTNKQCFGEAWYLAVDMQLFLVSPLLVYPLWKWERVGVALLSFITLSSIVAPAIVTYANNLPPTALPFAERGNFTQESYMVPWMRAAPYLMGLWVGYLLYRTKSRSLRLPKALLISCWLVTLSSGGAVVLGIQKYFDWRYKIPRVEGAIYSGFYHAIWGICVGWMVFACCRGGGGWINRFLSWKLFVPLGRLTYAIYLVSLNLQFLLHFSYRQPIYYDFYQAINLAFAHITMSLLVAFVVSLTMEAPFMELEKLLFKRLRIEQERRKVILNNEEEQRNYGAT